MGTGDGAYKLAALGSGLLFGVGLAIAHMTDPRKVLGFLDVRGDWDPSLALVLGAAVSVAFLGFRASLRQPRPLFGDRFRITNRRDCLNLPLLGGSALFGVGWGISGYCPGPAIAQLAAPNAETWAFLPALIVGSLLARALQRGTADPESRDQPTAPPPEA
jgi:uncharacterized membrane protein YedE/YeeE